MGLAVWVHRWIYCLLYSKFMNWKLTFHGMIDCYISNGISFGLSSIICEGTWGVVTLVVSNHIKDFVMKSILPNDFILNIEFVCNLDWFLTITDFEIESQALHQTPKISINSCFPLHFYNNTTEPMIAGFCLCLLWHDHFIMLSHAKFHDILKLYERDGFPTKRQPISSPPDKITDNLKWNRKLQINS